VRDPGPSLADLDPDQAAAVSTPSTLVAVIAGAGSGKTRVLTRRIAYRAATGTADAGHTLALTFTREAAGELRRRLRRGGLRERIEAGTFHAVALGLLRQRWIELDQRPPTVVGDRERLLAEVAAGVPVATLAAEADWAGARGVTAADYPEAARAAGRWVAASADRVAECLSAYAGLKRRRGVVDLDDLLAISIAELERDPRWAEVVRWRFRHVFVDEAQDLNPAQYRLLELVVGGRDDLYLVGDPAQAIYAFNGSDPALLAEIGDRLPGIEIIRLPTNHRSTPQIVAAGAHVLRESGQDVDERSSRPDGASVSVVATANEIDEATQVAQLLRGVDPDLVRLGHVAVLARTNAQLVRIRKACTDAGVRLRRPALEPGSPLANAVRAVTALPSATRLRGWAHDVLDVEVAAPGEPADPVETAERRLAAVVLEFLRDQPLGDGAGLRAWIAGTDPFSTSGDTVGAELLTFHGAKGREWHTVVVTGVETGLVPHRSATTVAGRAEEARLLHVALTRASDRLIVTWAARRGGYGRKPSPLIAGFDVVEPRPLRPPAELRRTATTDDAPLVRLIAWRQDAARAAAMLPDELCSDRDLATIAGTSPRSPEELAAVTGLGPLTAAKLFAPIRSALDGPDPVVGQPDRSTMTGA
jgi:DNA helicase II / ATP-dependent DNA helicase PcrA